MTIFLVCSRCWNYGRSKKCHRRWAIFYIGSNRLVSVDRLLKTSTKNCMVVNSMICSYHFLLPVYLHLKFFYTGHRFLTSLSSFSGCAVMTAPEQRCDHESALIDDNLHLFGGRNGRKYFPRNEIWTYNVREEKKWIRQFAEGKNVPPPCKGARCVAINGIMYSYGGEKEDEHCLGEVFALDPKKPKWIQVATPSHKDEPWQRAYCCLWAIGARMIMFAGCSGQEMIPQNRLQPGASCDYYVNNEIYEFEIEEGGEKGEENGLF